MATVPRSGSRSELTRDALLDAALEVFGRDGFHAASTRAISEAAGVNQALIAYHFGGKEGLYHAVFERITGNIEQHMGPLLETMRGEVASLDAGSPAGREACVGYLDQLIGGAINLFGQPEASQWVKLVMREQQDPGEAFDVFYQGVYRDMLALLTDITARLLGQPAESEVARVRALTLMGQVLVFVVGRGTVSRHVGWTRLGQREREMLHRTVRQSLQCLLVAEEIS